jgi:hypothetical protein
MHPAVWIALWHLLVDDSAPRRHPLDVAGPNHTSVPDTVTVLDRPRQDVSDGLDAAVWVPGEAGQVILRPLIAEVIEKKEGIEVGRGAKAKGAAQVYARTFKGRLRLD